MSCSETTAKVLKNELTISVTTQCGPNLPHRVHNLKHTLKAVLFTWNYSYVHELMSCFFHHFSFSSAPFQID